MPAAVELLEKCMLEVSKLIKKFTEEIIYKIIIINYCGFVLGYISISEVRK